MGNVSYTSPLAMMGVALDRNLPGRNAMLVNEIYVDGLYNLNDTISYFLNITFALNTPSA